LKTGFKKLLSAGTLVLLTGTTVGYAQPYMYPARGQSMEQQNRDEYECYSWARQQTGVDPSRPAPQPGGTGSAYQRGGVLPGAAAGAAVGAIGGAIGGNTGKGAAIGAGVGALGGGLLRRRAMEEEANVQRQAQAYQQQELQAYNRAFTACMEGRGYTVR